MRHLVTLLFIVIWLCPGSEAQARGRFSLELFGGVAVSANSTLTVRQDNEPELKVDANWDTRPLDQPFYWMFRFGYRLPKHGFEVQLIHHKLFLSNPPPEIERLEITHGFNLLTVNYAKRDLPVVVRVGAGVVLPHLDSLVRGKELSSGDGYRVSGPVFLGGAGKELVLTGPLFLNFEGQISLAWATIKVDGGEVSTFNGAIHALVGIGVAI